MRWLRDNWDKVLNTALAVFGAGGIVAFLSDFMVMCRERPWQAIFLAILCLSIGYALGLCNRPAAKARRERRRDSRERERERAEERERMFESIGRMGYVRKGLMLSAIANGSVAAGPNTIAQAMTLHREGYLNMAGLDGSLVNVFAPHSWMEGMANDHGKWEKRFKGWASEFEDGEDG